MREKVLKKRKPIMNKRGEDKKEVKGKKKTSKIKENRMKYKREGNYIE